MQVTNQLYDLDTNFGRKNVWFYFWNKSVSITEFLKILRQRSISHLMELKTKAVFNLWQNVCLLLKCKKWKPMIECSKTRLTCKEQLIKNAPTKSQAINKIKWLQSFATHVIFPHDNKHWMSNVNWELSSVTLLFVWTSIPGTTPI